MNPTMSKIIALSLLGVLGAGAGAWGVFHRGGKQADAAAVADAGPVAGLSVDKLRALSKEDPGKVFDTMRDTMDRKDLTDEERQRIGENMRTVMEERMQERVDEYFKAPEDEKDAILDKQIDEFEKFRKIREERDRQRDEAAKVDGKEQTEEERQKEREKRMEGWRKREAGKTQAQRKRDSESRNPNQMAQRMAYFGAMQKRMQARGIQPPKWGPGGGGPGGRRGP